MHAFSMARPAHCSLLGYIALVYAWLCDLLFNRAQLTAHLLSSAGGTVSPC